MEREVERISVDAAFPGVEVVGTLNIKTLMSRLYDPQVKKYGVKVGRVFYDDERPVKQPPADCAHPT